MCVGAGARAHCQPHPQGKIGDRLGFFPANFVQRVRPGENVWRCCQPFSGNKEQGYMSLKENQVSIWGPELGPAGSVRERWQGRCEWPGGGCLQPGSKRESRLDTKGWQGLPIVPCCGIWAGGQQRQGPE